MSPSKGVISFYEGDFVPETGYPFVLINSQWMRGASEYGFDVFLIVRHQPEYRRFTLETHRFVAPVSQAMLDGWHVENVEEFVEEEARDWVHAHLAQRWREALERRGVVVQREYELREKKWQESLRRLRWRGLPSDILESIKRSTENQEVINEIHHLERLRPIVLRDDPSRP